MSALVASQGDIRVVALTTGLKGGRQFGCRPPHPLTAGFSGWRGVPGTHCCASPMTASAHGVPSADGSGVGRSSRGVEVAVAMRTGPTFERGIQGTLGVDVQSEDIVGRPDHQPAHGCGRTPGRRARGTPRSPSARTPSAPIGPLSPAGPRREPSAPERPRHDDRTPAVPRHSRPRHPFRFFPPVSRKQSMNHTYDIANRHPRSRAQQPGTPQPGHGDQRSGRCALRRLRQRGAGARSRARGPLRRPTPRPERSRPHRPTCGAQ